MPESPGHGEVASLRITGADTEQHTVSLDVLVRVFHGIQQAVYLIAASKTQKKLTHRFKPSKEVRRHFELRAGALREGSVQVDLVANPDQQSIDLGLTPNDALAQFHEVLAAVSTEAEEALIALLNDTPYRDRVLRELASFLPKPGERWGMAFQFQGGPEIQLGQKHARVVRHWLQAAATGDDAVMTITCELLGIEFDRNMVAVRYKPTIRRFEVPYDTDSEELLFDRRRDDIQVTGRFETDDEGHPVRLSGEARIEMLDLSPFVLDRVERDGRALVITPPLELEPELDDEIGQYLVVADPGLEIDASARTREALLDELEEQLFYLYDTFALGDASGMTTQAAALAGRLAARLREESRAA
jgi:hypothetical protein